MIKCIPLNLKSYQDEQKMIRATVKQIDSVSKLTVPMTIYSMTQDTLKYSEDKDKARQV